MPCLTPINVRPKKGTTVAGDFSYHAVPCGKCANCKRRRINSWVFRLMQQDKVSQCAVFATLTYATPYLRRTPNGFATLCKSDVQSFIKRLRYNTGREIKYYLAGEYGSKTFRPHYHAIIFNATWDDIEHAWRDIKSKANPNGTNELMGDVMAPYLEPAAIAYTCKYIAKDSKIPMHDRDDRLPEFAVMSTNLGRNYIQNTMRWKHSYDGKWYTLTDDKATVQWHKENEANYVTMPGGSIQALPRYYREKIFDEEAVKSMGEIATRRHTDNLIKAVEKYGTIQEVYRALHAAAKQQNADYNTNNKRNKI